MNDAVRKIAVLAPALAGAGLLLAQGTGQGVPGLVTTLLAPLALATAAAAALLPPRQGAAYWLGLCAGLGTLGLVALWTLWLVPALQSPALLALGLRA